VLLLDLLWFLLSDLTRKARKDLESKGSRQLLTDSTHTYTPTHIHTHTTVAVEAAVERRGTTLTMTEYVAVCLEGVERSSLSR
jgi:hypothetical protein